MNQLLDKLYLSFSSKKSKAELQEARISFDNLFQTLKENKIDAEDLKKIQAYMDSQNKKIRNLTLREIASLLIHLIDIYLSEK